MTMKKFVILIAISFLSSCELFDDKSKTYELQEIGVLYNEIVALSESVPCTNSAEWKITPMGSKACGGPTQYIAYHQSVESRFLGLVKQYTELQAEYNKKNNIVSDCALVAEPRGIVCENGKPVFIGN
jgi:hypothetical protein